MGEAGPPLDEQHAVVYRPRAPRNRGRSGRVRKTPGFWLSLACLAIGIGCIGWALININEQARPIAYTETNPVASSDSATSVAVPVSSAGGHLPKKPSAPSATPKTARIIYVKNPRKGDTLGSLTIPTLGETLPIIEGTRDDDLKKGVGHYAQSVMPGQKDNCVLSAHRDTIFARLGELRKGDQVTVQTAAGTYTYQVTGTRIVDKDDRTVIVPTKQGVLTLTTCYPFDYIGPAPRRYIVSADLVAGK